MRILLNMLFALVIVLLAIRSLNHDRRVEKLEMNLKWLATQYLGIELEKEEAGSDDKTDGTNEDDEE